MLQKTTFTIVVALSITVLNFSDRVYAEGTHEHSHVSSEQQKTEQQKIEHDNHGQEHWASPKEASERPNPIESNKDSITKGAKSYELLCASCHGTSAMGDGVASASLDPKPTNLKAMSGGHKDGDFAWKIANGRGAMPAWETILNEDQIWGVVNYIQNLKNENINQNSKLLNALNEPNHDSHNSTNPDSIIFDSSNNKNSNHKH